MDAQQVRSHKRRNILQSGLLLGGMTVLLIAMGWLIAGLIGVGFALAGVILLAGGQRMSPQMILRMYRAQRLTPVEAPVLIRMVDMLRQRAALSVTPQVYYIRSAMMNAFAVGQPEDAAIGVTDGLLRRLNQRELAGVLAHEISHIANRDTWVMSLGSNDLTVCDGRTALATHRRAVDAARSVRSTLDTHPFAPQCADFERFAAIGAIAHPGV